MAAFGLTWIAGGPLVDSASAASLSSLPITERHANISRGPAAGTPKKEADQKLINGWPMYRTNRGQDAFNAAMATLEATDVVAPSKRAFKGCVNLHCHLDLPKIGKSGWIPAGRIWVAPNEYVLVVHSRRPKKWRRRSSRSMRYFIFHEFHNSTRNTDLYDTISAHKRSVFVPFYLGKEGVDARGQKFVVIVQVAPYDVVSRHASNLGSRGPGVEVAKNKWEELSSVQSKAGIVLATIVKRRAPRLRAVHHRHIEGLPMLKAYKRRLAALRDKSRNVRVRLPFTPVTSRQVQQAKAPYGALVKRKGVRRVARLARGAKPKAIKRVAKLPVPKPVRAVRRVATNVSVPKPIDVPAPELLSSGTAHGFSSGPILSLDALIERIFNEPGR